MSDKEIELTVPGMGSDHCAGIVRGALDKEDGVQSVQTHIGRHRVRVAVSESVSGTRLRSLVESAGYDVTSVSDEEGSEDGEQDYVRRARRNLWLAMVPTVVIMILMMPHMFWQPIPGYLAIIAVLAFPVVFIAGASTHRSAWRSARSLSPNMDVLISMGSLPPYFIGLVGFVYPMTSFIEMAATIMAFHLLGRYLEDRAKGRASSAIQKLLTLGPRPPGWSGMARKWRSPWMSFSRVM